MFYKHWKKIALTLTALFWAACEDSTSAEECLYGPPSYYGLPESSDASEDGSSSSEATGNETSSSSSEATKPESSSSMDKLSSSEVTCVPLDSSFMYFAQDYSADNAKFWKEEAAKHDAVAKIDSVKETLAETPMCLEHLRMELDQFVALYGAPTIIRNAVDSCSDGTIKPSEEYAKFLKMQEEWEANKSALEEELKKVYEDKMKEIEARINKCLNDDL
ncbi:MAG: hypothetical protein IIT53_08135 [Fibrobacter sp.]|nr:hypothetical protein [Fibrobacter sp.]